MTKGVRSCMCALLVVVSLMAAACLHESDPVPAVTPTSTPSAVVASATSTGTAASTAASKLTVIPGASLRQVAFEKAITLTDLSLLIASDRAAPVSERMATRIDRVTFDAHGASRVETLLEASTLGWRQFLTTVASPDGRAIVVSQCTRGDCALMGTTISADAQTTLVRSVDGGTTWSTRAVLDGSYWSLAFVGDQLLLRRFLGVVQTSQGGREEYVYSLYPSGTNVAEPAESARLPPFVSANGEVLWQSKLEFGRFVRSDGSLVVRLDASRWRKASITLVQTLESGRWVAMLSGAGCETSNGKPASCIALFNSDGSFVQTYAGAPSVYDLSRPPHLVSGVSAMIGLVSESNDAVPAVIDFATGVIRRVRIRSSRPRGPSATGCGCWRPASGSSRLRVSLACVLSGRSLGCASHVFAKSVRFRRCPATVIGRGVLDREPGRRACAQHHHPRGNG